MQESETYGIDFGIHETDYNIDESIVVPQLLQLPDDIYPTAEINALIEQPVETPFEVQMYLNVRSLLESI